MEEKKNEVVEAVVEEIAPAAEAVNEVANDIAKVYIGGAFAAAVVLTVAANCAWKYAIKPGVHKLKELKKQHDEKKLEKQMQLTSDEKAVENKEDKN